jgi:hypothetical protein
MHLPKLSAEASLHRSSASYAGTGAKCSSESIILSQDPDQQYFPGTYEQSCYGCSFAGDYLMSCWCYDYTGTPQYSTINLFWCRSDIANCNGQLTCGGC